MEDADAVAVVRWRRRCSVSQRSERMIAVLSRSLDYGNASGSLTMEVFSSSRSAVTVLLVAR